MSPSWIFILYLMDCWRKSLMRYVCNVVSSRDDNKSDGCFNWLNGFVRVVCLFCAFMCPNLFIVVTFERKQSITSPKKKKWLKGPIRASFRTKVYPLGSFLIFFFSKFFVDQRVDICNHSSATNTSSISLPKTSVFWYFL